MYTCVEDVLSSVRKGDITMMCVGTHICDVGHINRRNAVAFVRVDLTTGG